MGLSSVAMVLSNAIVGQSDLVRLLREVDQLDEVYRQAAIQQRVGGSTSIGDTHVSAGLQQLSDLISSELVSADGRQAARQAINNLLEQSPQVRIAFASEPPLAQLRAVVDWLRQNIHSSVLVQTSVQPAIVAGCIIRSSNNVFDLSLRRSFEAALPQLIKEVRAL